MKDQKKKHGKRAVIQDVMVKGISARKAAKTVDAVIHAWKMAVWSGEEVESLLGPSSPRPSRVRSGLSLG